MSVLSKSSVVQESSPAFADRRISAPRRLASHPAVVEPTLSTMRRRITSYINTHIDDPELSIDSIAAGIGCSRRYLHKAFDAEPETLSAMIWQLRLERCALNLRAAAMADRSITEIAFASGFNSSPHFSRLFRARYGMTARDWRKRRDPVPVELGS